MADNASRKRFIPLGKSDVIRMILEDGGLKTEQEKLGFEKFCDMMAGIFHFEFHEKLEKLKDLYFPMNPDLKRRCTLSSEDVEASNAELFRTLREVLDKANYEEVDAEGIAAARRYHAAMTAKVVIDFDDFETVQLFWRGRRRDLLERPTFFGLKKERFEHDILERVVLLVRFKPPEYFESKKRRNLPFEPGTTLIKLFKDVPKHDLEILFPNSRVTLGLKDALLLLVPAIVGGIPLLVSKVLPALIIVFVLVGAYFGVAGRVQEDKLKQVIAAFSAAVALGGFCLKQWMKYKNKRYQFQKELSDNLYFRNLVNNVGVFHFLIDSAEEEECKEAFLAYYFLYTADKDLTGPELDSVVERWFETKWGCSINFECDDAVGKLKRLNLLQERQDAVLKVFGFPEALGKLDEIWDGYFPYGNRSPQRASQNP